MNVRLVGLIVTLTFGLLTLPPPAAAFGAGPSMAVGHSAAPSGTASKGVAVSPGERGVTSGPMVRRFISVPRAVGALAVTGAGAQGYRSGRLAEESFLIVDAIPLDAQVFLDGRLLGSARELLARALPLPPGRHGIKIIFPGFRPYIAQFDADPTGFSTRIRVRLRRE